MDNLLMWLFLSGRMTDEESYLVTLSNNSLQTPSTFIAKQITAKIKDILTQVGDCIQSSEAIKIALRSLIQIVKSLNKKVLTSASKE